MVDAEPDPVSEPDSEPRDGDALARLLSADVAGLLVSVALVVGTALSGEGAGAASSDEHAPIASIIIAAIDRPAASSAGRDRRAGTDITELLGKRSGW
ncbi:hypothetical protein [Gordonia sp. SCSIO 19800]|uniref:hypothetical protein n=1 Tax=Gordonia sp. SCSIO 19800 TaxID=2826926 RepID=UPI002013868F|nr:hypothetical protein [Gordonia sp. SCSIO 19800]